MKSPKVRRRPDVKEQRSARSARSLFPAVVPDPAQQTSPPPLLKFISKATMLQMVNKTWPTVWKWMQEDQFPRARNTGGTASWIESEVQDWMRNRPLQPLKGDDDDKSVTP
jgi:predicted DNA-binding transcriptional regulator AlpA